jgi:hypothetical protein
LNPNQDEAKYRRMIKGEFHIEHILPKKWNNYDKWTQSSWSTNLNALGNLVPLEWNLNISARNEFFSKKQEYYKDSAVFDVTGLLGLNEWHPSHFEERHQIVQERVLGFFSVD